MVLWFVISFFWLVHFLKSDNLEIDHAELIIVRVQLDWYSSHGVDIASHAQITPSGPERYADCKKEPGNCTNLGKTYNWEFNLTDSWDQFLQMEWIAFNATALEQQFWWEAPGERWYPIGTALQQNIEITLEMSRQNHGAPCINVSLTRNGEIYGPLYNGSANYDQNITLSGSGDVGDEWGLYVVIAPNHSPMVFNATIVQTYGFSGKVSIIPTFLGKVPLSLGEEFTIDFGIQNEYEAHAGAQIFYKPCESRTPSGKNKKNPCGKQDKCYEDEHGVCAAQCSNQKNSPNDKTGSCKKGMWWWWILLIAGVVLLALIIGVVVFIILRKRKPRNELYVPPENMPICPVIVMCDGDTKEDPGNPLLRKRQVELQREQDAAAVQREREKVHLNIRGNSPGPEVSAGFTGGANRYNQIPGNNAGSGYQSGGANRLTPGSGNSTGGANRFNPAPGGINAVGFNPRPGFGGKK